MKVTKVLPPPVEHTIRVDLSVTEASTLTRFLGSLSYDSIRKMPGNTDRSVEKLTDDLYDALLEAE